MEQLSLNMRRKYLPREDRLTLTYEIIVQAGCPVSLFEICKRQGVVKTGHMRGIVDELIEEGSIAHGPERKNACGHNTVTYIDGLCKEL